MCSFSSASFSHVAPFLTSSVLCKPHPWRLTPALGHQPLDSFLPRFPSPPPHFAPPGTRHWRMIFTMMKTCSRIYTHSYHLLQIPPNLYIYKSYEKKFSVLSEQRWRHFFASQPHRNYNMVMLSIIMRAESR